MSNNTELAPLDFSGIPPPSRLKRAQNMDELYRPEPEPIGPPPRLLRSTNSHEVRAFPVIWTPMPARQAEEPPRLTREDERRRVTPEEIEAAARKLW
jgi:hypothetical protein